MEYLIMLLVYSKVHFIVSFLMMLFLCLLAVIFINIMKGGAWINCVFLLLPLYLINIFAGHFVTNILLEHFGEKGEGVVINRSETSIIYNEERVWRYNVLLKGGSEEIFTYFLTDEFNIIHKNSFNKYYYPTEGIKFNVYYLKKYPKAFVIIANDDSDYSKSLYKINSENKY